jgi:hypothetical protein
MNKLSIILLTIFSIGVISFFSTGCKKDSPKVTEFIITVDSVKHADTINVGEAFETNYYASIGNSDCYEFSKVENEFGTNLIEVTLIGKFTERDNCQPGNQYLNPATVNFTDLTAGDWKLKVLQPEGISALESFVHVK